MASGDASPHGRQGQLSAQRIAEPLARRKQTVVAVHPVVELQAIQVESGSHGYAILDAGVIRPELRHEPITGIISPRSKDVSGSDGVTSRVFF